MYVESTDVLDATSDATATATEPSFVVSYAAIDVTGKTLTPANAVGSLNGTSAVNLIGSPASGVQRQLKYLNIRNVDTVSHVITVRFNRSSTPYTLLSGQLEPGESLVFTPENGFVLMNTQGAPKAVYTSQPGGRLLAPVGAQTGNTTSTFTLGTTGLFTAVYMGATPYRTTSVDIQFQVTTAAATITWAEIAVLRGFPRIGTFPTTLDILGWLDISGVVNTTGIKTVTVPLNVAAAEAGDSLWVGLANVATTSAVVRALGLGDIISAGFTVTCPIATRPSTSGSTVSPTAASNAARQWVALYVS